MTRDDAVALQRRRVGSVLIPFPVLSGAMWRVLGLVTFTIVDKDGGTIIANVQNDFGHTVKAGLLWTWSGKSGLSHRLLTAGQSGILQVNLPSGFDAPLEALVNDTP
jgi:hypothetical protein